jgi:hypothetical protein
MKESNGDDDPYNLEFSETPWDESKEQRYQMRRGVPLVMDLDWYPEMEMEDDSYEPPALSAEELQIQVFVHYAMYAIENLDSEETHEMINWDKELIDKSICLVPERIQLVPGKSQGSKYPRFWGFLCSTVEDIDNMEAKRISIPLPSKLSRNLGFYGEEYLNYEADPMNDSSVAFLFTIYRGLSEFEIQGEIRHAHNFMNTLLVIGNRTED